MITEKQINPKNMNQARLFFDMYKAFDEGEKRNPCTVMNELADKHGFKILGRIPQTLFDGWDFWIEHDDITNIDLPPLFRDVPWKPVGEA